MALVNIVFQIMDDTQTDPSWENSKIIKVIQNRQPHFDVTDELEYLSGKHPGKTIRFTRIPVDQTISVEHANRLNGGYWQSR